MNHAKYADTLRALFALSSTAVNKPMTLDSVIDLNIHLNHPTHTYPSVHVAGSNGKGSVVTKISSALTKAGYRVGTFTSPHISSFRERITISGNPITEAQAVEGLNTLTRLCQQHEIEASFFELTTCLAFHHFATQEVDIAVVEAGLGGRLDATNILTPILSVITSISLEHTRILGDTREAIAQEKAGIIKYKTPVVVGPHADLPAVRNIAFENSCDYIVPEGPYASYDDENAAIAQEALYQLREIDFHIPNGAISFGIKQKPPCRFELLSSTQITDLAPYTPKEVVLDVAHNPDGIAKLVHELKARFPKQQFQVVCGFSKGKDLQESLVLLSQLNPELHLVAAEHPRALDVNELASELPSNSPARLHASIKEGIVTALKAATSHNAIVVICGSFFIMADARDALGLAQDRDPIDLNEAVLPTIDSV